jgi:signal transduction histidine kinase
MSKRRPVKNLAQQVRLQLLWLGIGLFFACLLLVTVFALRSANFTIDSLMQLEADSLLRQMSERPELPLPMGKSLSAYRRWEEIPASARQHFDGPPVTSGKFQEALVANNKGEVEYYYLLRQADDELGEIFLLSRYDRSEIFRAIEVFAKAAFGQALWLTLIIFTALFFLIRWLIHRTTEPLALLSRWATDLNNNPEQPSAANFPIAELNEIAQQLHEGVERIEAYNLREREFLKYASHELRTPLAIIQASLDTLALQSDTPERPAVGRALRASTNMRLLSSALLWLARESEQPIEKSRVDAGSLCEQIIQDHRYLLENREVEIRTRIDVEALEIESDLLAIVIANLIRNAFQYSVEGVINLEMSKHDFTITNPTSHEETKDDSTRAGYGLGLQLVQRICKKLQWQFDFSRNSENNITVCVRFKKTT